MRLHVLHRTSYRYPRPAAFGPHLIRLRPATHARARIESYGLHVSGDPKIHWLQDPFGNHVGHVTFEDGVRQELLEVRVELTVDVRPVNPFDFYLDERCKAWPFTYPPELLRDLSPFLASPADAAARGPRLARFLEDLPAGRATLDEVVDLNQRVNRALSYITRDEPGIWTPEETLGNGRGSCRDSAVLLIAALRARGFAARFVSGYLIQLTDEGMIPDQPKGVGRDVVDLHAWAEVYLPGAGWVGLDATSGLFCGEGHIPLACTALPALATPLDGTSDVTASEVSFEMRVARLGHETRTTAPFTDETWSALLAAGDRADAVLAGQGLRLTLGGEPTFTSREHPLAPEWNGKALGPTKWAQGLRLAQELRRTLCPGAALLVRQGKHYPGESPAPLGARAGGPAGRPAALARGAAAGRGAPDARRRAPAGRRAGRAARAGRRRDRRLRGPVGGVAGRGGAAARPRRGGRQSGRRRGSEAPGAYAGARPRHPGRLRPPAGAPPRPLADRRLELPPRPALPGAGRLAGGAPPAPLLHRRPALLPPPEEPRFSGPPDPRRTPSEHSAEAEAASAAPLEPVRTALCVEPREEALRVFLPPVTSAADFEALVSIVDAARQDLGLPVELEGYPPPAGGDLLRFSVTPDPGVLEVNLPPTAGTRAHAALMGEVFDAALHAGLTSEKYLLDGRLAGSGGGNHLTMGGPTAPESPFLLRPDLLASLITFLQHHPSLSYLFTGLFVGPTSQAPRPDEARHDALYELEIALARAFDRSAPVVPWLGDLLFRHLLVDVSGNTHRAELCIDKLHDWRTPSGRQGLVELRAFEMPPHPRMASAQMTLVRALVAAFAAEPYRAPLVRWGTDLHDRFLLPAWLWRDLEDVLAFLAARGLALPAEAYRAFLELRCPVAGRAELGGVTVEVRNALEPWHVLGEEATQGGTSRYVDSSVERIEVRAEGLVPERHQLLVNGYALPLRSTGTRGEQVGGVRFRAWAPPHSLHAHLGIHHPIQIDVVDTWARRSVGACAYHVWHPEGTAFDEPPLTRFEAAARRAKRFTLASPLAWPVVALPAAPHPEMPYTLDLRRFPGDRPPPAPTPEAEG